MMVINILASTVRVGFAASEIVVPQGSTFVDVEVTILSGSLASNEVVPLDCITVDGTARGMAIRSCTLLVNLLANFFL